MTFTQELQQFVQEKLVGDAQAVEIGENDALLDRGILDSMGLLQLMTFIEERTQLRIPDNEVTPDNFNTIADIDRLVQRLKS